jgi:hypothetical protein
MAIDWPSTSAAVYAIRPFSGVADAAAVEGGELAAAYDIGVARGICGDRGDGVGIVIAD